MKTINLGNSGILASEIGLGCMRMNALTPAEVERVIKTSMEAGINFFDHADIYGAGASEEIFAKAITLTPSLRENIILQTKCGIIPGKMYDFSKEHILSSVDKSLQRLHTDYVDTFLLHRPDALMEPDEVAEAFSILQQQGKVRHFGVSNHTPMQMELLSKSLDTKLIINQLQFGVMHTGMIDSGLMMNMKLDGGINRDGEILDYCRLKDITIQAWSPFQYGFFEGVFLDNPKFPEVNKVINELAEQYNVSNTAIATAWILRHPAKIQTIVGTMTPARIEAITKASSVCLTREEWYRIYLAAGNMLP